MSKVTLLAINAKYVHSSLAVWVVAGGVLKYARLPHNLDGAALPIRSGHKAPRPYLSGAAPRDPSFCDGILISPEPQQASEPSGRVQANQPVDPYSDAYFNALGGRIAYIETSRGCPFKCAFCLSGGTGVRFFPMGQVKEQAVVLPSGKRVFVDSEDRDPVAGLYRLYTVEL